MGFLAWVQAGGGGALVPVMLRCGCVLKACCDLMWTACILNERIRPAWFLYLVHSEKLACILGLVVAKESRGGVAVSLGVLSRAVQVVTVGTAGFIAGKATHNDQHGHLFR